MLRIKERRNGSEESRFPWFTVSIKLNKKNVPPIFATLVSLPGAFFFRGRGAIFVLNKENTCEPGERRRCGRERNDICGSIYGLNGEGQVDLEVLG